MSEEDKSKIAHLRDVLYSRKIKIKPTFVLDLHGHKSSVTDKWQEQIETNTSEVPQTPRRNISRTLFWLAVAFFTVSLGIASFVYQSGSNLISPNNIKIEVVGPNAIKAGEKTSLDIAVTNNNRTTLEFADLLINYPKGTRDPNDKLSALTHARVAFGDVLPGETVRRTVNSMLYGEIGKPITIGMSLEYRLPNSTSVFNKDITYEALVGSAPLTVSV
jgi:preprotein translocase subunit SecG